MKEVDRQYAPMGDHPNIQWPNEARVAFWVSPTVMYYEYMPPENKLKRDPWPRTPHPDVKSYSRQDYGKRIGFWRLLEVLDKHGIRATPALNVAVLEHFPDICQAMVERKWAFMASGIYNTRYVWGYDEEEERALWRDVVQTVLKHTGQRIKGVLGPGPQSATVNTPNLIAEEGFLYHGAWLHYDQPFPIPVKQGRLVSLPYTFEISDNPRLATTWEGEDMVRAVTHQFDRLYEEGAESGKVMTMSMHPYIVGMPHRTKYLDQALDYVLSHDKVWAATGDEIAEYYIANYYDLAMASLNHQDGHERE